MKNIHVLPTEKPSRLCIKEFDNKLCLHTDEVTYHGISQYIYITNDEETKLKDWFISSTLVLKATDILDCDDDGKLEIHSDGYCNPLSLVKKIILTTDPQLIVDGVQAIDDEFLEWFVKNTSCEEVGVKRIGYCKPMINEETDIPEFDCYEYKIIIPKEEPKQDWYCPKCQSYVSSESVTFEETHQLCNTNVIIQEFEQIDQNNPMTKGSTALVPKKETIEEVAKQYSELIPFVSEIITNNSRLDFIAGAKWQQERSYSEEDMMKAVKFGELYKSESSKSLFEKRGTTPTEVLKRWFNEFKKK